MCVSDDLNLEHDLVAKVYIRDHDCHDHVEKLYYAEGLKFKYQPCCIHCGENLHDWEDEDHHYPQC